MPAIEILCLANSRKHGGRCIGGLRMDGGGWVRLVSSEPDGTLYPRHYLLDDGSEPQPLDRIAVPIAHPCPKPHQPENVLLLPQPWRLRERPLRRSAAPLLRNHLHRERNLFGDAADRIPYERLVAQPPTDSLALVIPDSARVRIRLTSADRRQTRLVFTLAGAVYDLAVTDPAAEGRRADLAPGEHPLRVPLGQKLLLTISLGEPFEVDGCCYKLVASILSTPAGWWI